MAKVQGWKVGFDIIHFQSKPVGLVLVQTRKWLPFLTACRIYRNPLWIYDEIPGEMLKLVLGIFRQRYQLRRGWLLMFHPDLRDVLQLSLSTRNRFAGGDSGLRKQGFDGLTERIKR
ncbi:hypothetical protein [Skermanella stibiiresistens]|jgi:hypothetical protein|uniref:hypothetical protein n=1 Tax=Skermanella stibiiresistens TaxID=913326 RepID=UPI0012F9D6A3|nr:hypothetical protein [Skermanella stibiiresistens]